MRKPAAILASESISVVDDVSHFAELDSGAGPDEQISKLEISLKPGPNARVEMGGRKVEYSTLKKDDVLTFEVPERQLGVISDPHDTASSTIILN